MIPFDFEVLDVSPQVHAAAPTLNFRMRIASPDARAVESIALRAQIRIEPQRRHYRETEKPPLEELFGEPWRWGETLKPFLWAHASTTVRGFAGSGEFDLPVACTYDFEVAAAKYLHSLDDGEVPLILLFSGSVFSNGANGLQVLPMSWNCEARYRMPVRVWRALMDGYFPDSGWLRLRREVLDALLALKAKRAVATFDELLLELAAEKQARSGEEAA